MNFLDAVLILTVLLGAFRGKSKGLIVMLSRTLSYLLAILLAAVLYNPIGELLNNIFNLSEKLNPLITKQVALSPDIINTPIKEFPFYQLIEKINQQNIPGSYKKIMSGYLTDIQSIPAVRGIEKIGDGISNYVSLFLVKVFAFLLIYYTAVIIFRFLIKRANRNISFIGIGAINKIGGFIAGGLSSVVGIATTIFIITPLITLTTMGKNTGVLVGIGKIIQHSALANFFINLGAKFVSG